MIKYLAIIAAWVGEKDLACEQLATASVPRAMSQLWPIETDAVLGSAARRPAFRENRRFPRAEVETPPFFFFFFFFFFFYSVAAEPALSEVEWACRLHPLQSSRHGCLYSPDRSLL